MGAYRRKKTLPSPLQFRGVPGPPEYQVEPEPGGWGHPESGIREGAYGRLAYKSVASGRRCAAQGTTRVGSGRWRAKGQPSAR